MSYKLIFHKGALKEWKKIDPDTRAVFKKILERRLENPHIASAKLSGKLKGCYKIKLRKSGYRLVYTALDDRLIVLVAAVGKRNKEEIYSTAIKRL